MVLSVVFVSRAKQSRQPGAGPACWTVSSVCSALTLRAAVAVHRCCWRGAFPEDLWCQRALRPFQILLKCVFLLLFLLLLSSALCSPCSHDLSTVIKNCKEFFVRKMCTSCPLHQIFNFNLLQYGNQ